MLANRSLPAIGSFAVVVALIAFVISGYAGYIDETVFYPGMRPSSYGDRYAVAVGLLALSIVGIFIRGGNYVVKIVAWLFNVWANVSYFVHFQMHIEIALLSTAAFFLFCVVVQEGKRQPVLAGRPFVDWFFWLTLFCAGYFFASNGFKFSLSLFLFEGVYDARWEVTGGRNFLENLLFSTVSKLFSLLALGIYLQQRNMFRVAALTVAILLLYSTSAQKSILFFLALTYCICWPRSTRASFAMALGFAAFLFVLTIAPQSPGSPGLAAHTFLTRRLLLIPAWLNEAYFNYFAGKPLFLKHSVLNGITGVYDGPGPTWEMGYQLWGFGTSLNNGVLSDGFVNFGLIGSALYLIIGFGTIALQSRFAHPATKAVSALYIWQLTNSALITTFVTHGLLLYVAIGFIFFRRGVEDRRGREAAVS
ncbi:hypothetical protein K9B35_19300 [Sphingomonas sp. R647]|uniref:hypothetical protein n=1 Tax=Sphingomonas sp. R647 TaxID=2875233 RepID=UPI001CD7F0FE|nr:hypothetical protein [Sphingomonas sp. R647]MCA1200119.1 hypothetical protein [Sphingomonas sp. R647]